MDSNKTLLIYKTNMIYVCLVTHFLILLLKMRTGPRSKVPR